MFRRPELALWRQRASVGVCLFALVFNNLNAFGENTKAGKASASAAGKKAEHTKTATPIKHVIVLIGENRSFDHLFATYMPKDKHSVSNLLSKRIINPDGSPGPHFKKAQQFKAVAPFRTDYFISLNENEKTPYEILPDPTLNFSPSPDASIIGFATEPPPFPASTPLNVLAAMEPSLETQDLHLLTTGASGQNNTFVLTPVPDFDTRVANFDKLPNGPFPLKGAKLPYDSYTGDTTHRLFEMWQQSDCCHISKSLCVV